MNIYKYKVAKLSFNVILFIMRKLINVLTVLVSLFFFSCSESGSDGPSKGQPELVLTVEPTEIIANNSDQAVFTVKNQAGEDVTNTCVIYVNGEELFDNTFATDKSGKYEAIAKSLKGEESNTVLVYAVSPTAEFTISANKTAVVADGSGLAVLTLIDETGIDVTRDAVFFVDGDTLESNLLAIETDGLHKVTAEWNGISSTTSLSIAGVSFTQSEARMLAEYSTFTGCQFCQKEIPILEGAAEKDSRFVLVAVHRQASSVYQKFDANTRAKVEQFVEYFGGNVGSPSTFLNRAQGKVPTDLLGVDALLAKIPNSTYAGISLRTELAADSSSIQVRAGVTSTEAIEGHIGVILVENGIMAEQYGMGMIEMEQTMRDYQPSFVGETFSVTPGVLAQYETEVALGRAKFEECNVIVFVTGADGKVVNVQQVKAGSSIGY